MYRATTPIISRKRAFSENLEFDEDQEQLAFGTPQHLTINRISSDTDLNKIDKQKTFESAQMVAQTTDLLARVVTALGKITVPEEDISSVEATKGVGVYHGLTDSQILASEKWPYTTLTDKCPYPKRERASSNFFISPQTIVSPSNNEWTWGGDNTRIQQVINNRVRNVRKRESLYKASFGSPTDISINMQEDVFGLTPVNPTRKISTTDAKSLLKRFLPFKRRPTEDSLKNHLEKSSVNSKTTEVTNYKGINNFQRRESLSNVESPIPHQATSRRFSRLFNCDERRGSKYSVLERQSSGQSVVTAQATATSTLSPDRRGSLFSMPSYDEIDHDLLETTTIADLIRAIEVIHTRANLQEDTSIINLPKRKMGTASLTPPRLSPLYTLFPPSNNESPSSFHRNLRRHTIFSSPSFQPSQQTISSSPRRMSAWTPINPPPYTGRSESPKIRRRFSVRPTNLQIPPGKAPTPSMHLFPTSSTGSSTPKYISTQTPLQRRLSLRPSPLAREISTPDIVSGLSSYSSSQPIPQSLFSRHTSEQSSFERMGPNTNTFSPLSRYAQMQSLRKISLPETSPVINDSEDEK